MLANYPVAQRPLVSRTDDWSCVDRSRPYPCSSYRCQGGVRTRIVLDTSVLVADPSCIASFVGADVVIPLTVIEELDGLKSRVDDVGRAAHGVAYDRGASDCRQGRLPTPRPSASPGVGHRQIEINGCSETPPPRARARSWTSRQPDHRRRTRSGEDLRRRWCPTTPLRIKAAHLGFRPPNTFLPVDALRHARRVGHDRDDPRRDRLASMPPAIA